MKRFFVALVALFAVLGILEVVNAGSLTPSTSPAGTLYTLGDIFNPLASTSYDSSGISGDSDGSVLEITKCIIEKLHGGSC